MISTSISDPAHELRASLTAPPLPTTPRRDLLPRARILGGVIWLALTLSLGLGLDTNPGVANRVSSVLGWAYFSAWSLSFYPQLVLNWQRRSVVGLSFDYAGLNMVGFTCYALFNCFLLWDPATRAEYAKANGGRASAVKVNDAVFALHAAALTAVQLGQIYIYERGAQRFSRGVKVALGVFALLCPVGVGLAAAGAPACGWLNPALILGPLGGQCTMLTLLSTLAYVKLAITLTKYVPQAVLNARRRSTEGWNIDNVVLDFTGGTLSLAQLLLDAGVSHDWSQVRARRRDAHTTRHSPLFHGSPPATPARVGERRPRQVRPRLHLDGLRHNLHDPALLPLPPPPRRRDGAGARRRRRWRGRRGVARGRRCRLQRRGRRRRRRRRQPVREEQGLAAARSRAARSGVGGPLYVNRRAAISR